MICEHTCVRNAEEEENFFQRQIVNENSGYVLRIEAPNACFGECCIPNEKEECGDESGQPQIFPLAMKTELRMKRENERNKYAAEINKQVGEVRIHFTAATSALL